jgi:hypothetical protein
MERWQGSLFDTEFHGVHTEFHRVVKQRSALALRQMCTTETRSADKNLLRETPCALGEALCRTVYFVGTATGGVGEQFPAQTNTT